MMCEFKAVCDWPGCGRLYPGAYYGSMDMFDVLNNPDWLTLFGGRDGDRAFHFCSKHIRYDRDPNGLPFAAEFDPDGNLAEEMADVTICLHMLQLMYDVSDADLDEWIGCKIRRQKARNTAEGGRVTAKCQR